MKAAEPSKEIVFTLAKGRVLRLTPQALVQLAGYKQTKLLDEEAGGILLGRIMDPSDDIIVDSVTVPDKDDKRRFFSFWRARDPHQKRVNEAWKDSDGTSNYLGEWHSHPEDHPSPSGHDVTNWKRIVREAKYEQDALIFVIVGRKQTRAWSLSRSQRAPELLVQLDAQ